MATELEQNLNKPVVEAKSFRVIKQDGTVLCYDSDEEFEYQWAPTQAGGLLIYRKTKHKMFSAVIADERILMLADGQWKEVEMIDED